jgi:hypothetical protein
VRRTYTVSAATGRDAELLLPGSLNESDLSSTSVDVINRSAIVVMPAQPFLDWLHRADSTSAHLTLEDLRREPTIYLLPECDSQEEAFDSLREVSRDIFEKQLNGWYRVPSVWPSERDFATFLRWFECSFHSMIFDLCEDPLEHEEI